MLPRPVLYLGLLAVVMGVLWLTSECVRRYQALDQLATEVPGFDDTKLTVGRIVKLILIIVIGASAVLGLLLLVLTYVPDGYRYLVAAVTTLTVGRVGWTLTERTWQRLSLVALGFAISLAWLVAPNWLTLDLGALVLASAILVTAPALRLKGWAVLLVGIVIYDVTNVFGTGLMMKAATHIISGDRIALPILLIAPQSLSLSASYAMVLGLGDVVLPGFVIIYAARLSRQYGTSWFRNAALIGYLVGQGITLTVVVLAKVAQPATLYLVPGVIAGILLAGYRTGHLRELLPPRTAPELRS